MGVHLEPDFRYSGTSGNEHSNLPTMDKLFALYLYIVHTFLPPKKRQPLNNGQNARPQHVHYSEVPLYCLHTPTEGHRMEYYNKHAMTHTHTLDCCKISKYEQRANIYIVV